MCETHDAVVRPQVRVILEEGPRNWSAYVPSIPGCIAAAKTRDAVQRKIESALTFHLEHLHEDALREETEDAARAAQRATMPRG